MKRELFCICETNHPTDGTKRILRLIDRVQFYVSGRFSPVDYVPSPEEDAELGTDLVKEGRRFEVNVEGYYMLRGYRTIRGSLDLRPRRRRLTRGEASAQRIEDLQTSGSSRSLARSAAVV